MSSKNTPILKSQANIRVGITMGDPSGIGPQILFGALHKLKGLADFIVIGDKWVFDKIQNLTTRRVRPSAIKNQNFKFIDLNNVPHKNFKFGKVRAEYGRASMEYLDKALELIKDRELDCLVTCPISKEAINLGGFHWPGHTEYLAKQTHTENFVMMLLNKKIKIALVTRHLPLKDVPLQLNKDKIYKTIFLTYKSLKELFLIKNPHMVVCGLNPHASDNGLIGKEENNIIRPVLERLRLKIRYIDGPLASDIAILKASQNLYDCVIAMYHDQALIPLKILGMEKGVNITLGLPFVRTSPLHGTAFDIAATFSAHPASLIEAIRMAIKCTLNLRRA